MSVAATITISSAPPTGWTSVSVSTPPTPTRFEAPHRGRPTPRLTGVIRSGGTGGRRGRGSRPSTRPARSGRPCSTEPALQRVGAEVLLDDERRGAGRSATAPASGAGACGVPACRCGSAGWTRWCRIRRRPARRRVRTPGCSRSDCALHCAAHSERARSFTSIAHTTASGDRRAIVSAIGPAPHPTSSRLPADASGTAVRRSNDVPASSCPRAKTPRSVSSVNAVSGSVTSMVTGSDATVGSSAKYCGSWPCAVRWRSSPSAVTARSLSGCRTRSAPSVTLS